MNAVENMDEVLRIALERLPNVDTTAAELEAAIWQTPTIIDQSGTGLNS